jgi:peptide/nickel transport system permease protein
MAEISRALEGEGQPREVVADSQGMEAVGRTQWQIAWRRFRRHKMALVGLFVLSILYLSAIFAPLVAPFDPVALDLENLRQGPSMKHLMGTDALGRDLFSRVVYGGRVSLAVGIGVAMSAGIIGTAIGALAGYYGRFLDAALMRTTDFFLSMPFLVVLMMGARALGGSVYDIVLVVSFVTWMPVARIVRGVFLSIKEKEYIEAARALGAGGNRIILRHMLPNALGPIIVNITLTIALAILVESTLSFLGFGIQPPTATWGNMVAGAKDSMVTQPWIMLFPGLMIFITVLCVNFVGDGLRDALDPTTTRVRA